MKNILFIEDESALQKTIGDILESKNYKVIKVLDGESGLRSAKEERPDLILLGLILPKMDGFEVLKVLKASEETKNIPVIILTNLEETENIQKALELGATTYLVKSSYTLEEVVKKIEKTLEE